MNHKILIFFLFHLLLISCKPRQVLSLEDATLLYDEKESNKVQKCSESWEYEDLQQKLELRVLYFNSAHTYSVVYLPNFVIGVLPNNDTIGLTDYIYKGKIKVGKTITVQPYRWDELFKEYYRVIPTYSVIDQKENDLMCSVKIVYWGKISR